MKKKTQSKNSHFKTFGPAGIVFLALLFFLVGGLRAQTDPDDIPDYLLTDPFLKIGSETVIEGPISGEEILSPTFFITDEDYRGEVSVNQLTGDRSYLFPDISGEVCLSAGNCDTAHTGTEDRLVRFGPAGLVDSSIQDFYPDVAVTIDDLGRVGVGIDDPQYGIHAGEDICTELGGGVCLSEVMASIQEIDAEPEDVLEDVVQVQEGRGETGKIPLWRDNNRLGDSVMRQSAGQIGIGTSPSQTLDVSGTVRMLGFRMPVSPEEGYGLMSDERGVGTWRPVLTPRREEADVAEKFPLDSDCESENVCPRPGDLVSVSEGKVIRKAEKAYDEKLIGVISTDPALTLGSVEKESAGAVALIGRVPTRVSLEGGEINVGDRLTSSNTPGVAKKATGSGRVIGMALESFSKADQSKGKEKITVFINPHEKHKEVPEELKLTDTETGETYCIQIKNGELKKLPCQK